MSWAEGVIHAFTEAVVVLDASLRVVGWNDAAKRLTGREAADTLGIGVTDALSFLDGAASDLISRALAGEPVTATEVEAFLSPHAASTWLDIRAVPWRKDGAIAGVVLLVSDVTAGRHERVVARAFEAVGQALGSSLDLNEVLDTIVTRALEVMSGGTAMVVGWDGESAAYAVLRAAGRLSREYVAAGAIPAGRGPIYRAVKEARPIATSNILADPDTWLTPERRRDIELEGFRAVAAAPLAAKGRVHGALVVHYWSERTFSDDEIAILSRLARQAAIAIDNARLYGEATRRAERLRELAEVEELVTASLDLEEILRRIADATARLLGAPLAQVWTLNGESRAFERRAASIAAAIAEEVLPAMLPHDDPLARLLAKERSIVFVPDVAQAAMAPSMGWSAGFGLPVLLAVPIAVGDDLLGALTVHGRAGWAIGDEDRALVVSLAARVARAIENAHAYRRAVHRAERLGQLVAVTQSISASLDTASVMQRIANAAAALSPGAGAIVHGYDRERDVLRSLAVSGGATRLLPAEIPAGVGLPGMVLEERRPVVIHDPSTHPRTLVRDWWQAHPRATYFGVPIVAGDTLLGVLGVIVPERSPSLEEQELLMLLAAHAGVAIHNASVYESERHQGEQVRALAEVNQRISSALELDELLQAIAESAANLTGVRYASFWLADDTRERMTFSRGSDPAISADVPRPVLAYSEGAVGWVARHRTPLVVDDVAGDPRVVNTEWWVRWGIRALSVHPVVAGEELLAILVLSDAQPVRFAPHTQDTIELFTAQAAVAIQNARLYREAKRRRDVAEALARVGRELTETLAVDRIEEIVTRGMVQLLDVRGGAVYRYVPEDGTLVSSTSYGLDADAVRGLVLRPGEGGLGLAVQTRKLVVSSNILSDPGIFVSPEARARVEPRGFRAIMAAPLLARDRVLGGIVVGAEAGRDFSADEMQVFQAFADQAALALENARLYAESDRERREAAALAMAARQLAASLDLDELAPQLVEVLRELFGAHASALYRRREDGALVSVAFGGAAREHMRGGEVIESRVGIAGRAVEARHPVWTRDVLNDADIFLTEAFRAAIVASGNRAVLTAPLIAKNEVIGVLAVSDNVPRDYSEHEAALLQAFADQAALAIENARLYASARDSLARLRETQVQLVQAAKMSALGQLVSGVAHELNNPLSVVIGYGQLLLARDLPAPVRRPVELMVSQGDRMAKIVRSLLFFARQRPPERVPVRINQVVEETLTMRLNQLTLSGITLERRLGADLPLIAADAQQLQQVFLNLLLNAEQAILEVRSSGRILVRTSATDDGAALRAEVIDDGPGIPASALPHVFEPFFTTKEVGVGTGLGLSVSYGILQEHGGRLSVESCPGETIFTVELPVMPLTETPAVIPAPPLRATTVSGRAALVVEDEPDVSDLVLNLLQDTGWEVDLATGGRSGLERVRARRYDLVVSDIRMPDGNGEDLYRGATAFDPTLARRFIFITGDTANPSAWRFLREHGVPVLEKPFAPATFLDAVRRVTASLTPSPSSA